MSEPTETRTSDTPCWTVQQSPTPEPRLPHDAELAAVVLEILNRRPRWMTAAACRTTGLDWHQPILAKSPDLEVMRRTCQRCPVLADCADWVALDRSTDELPGVLAGLTRYERRRRPRRNTKD
jgi:hypothetical protein